MEPESSTINQQVWWGTFELASEQVARWQVGPTTLWLYRTPKEWRLVYVQTQDSMDARADVELPASLEEMQNVVADDAVQTTVDRFPFERTAARLEVYPALADRPVIIRPETPLYILPDEAAKLYVSSPLWVQIEVGRQSRLLHEIPSYRPSDTWFGPSTQAGELCYASRTNGRLNLESLPRRWHRAITPVRVKNRGTNSLLLDRLQLPVQYLSLFRAENDFLWTQTVVLQRHDESDLATVRLSDGAPQEAAGGSLVREPRQKTKENLMMRTFGAFSSLFS